MKHMFLEKFFSASRTVTIRKKIYGIRQHFGETLHEYWERFNKLCATCPHHYISEQLLIQYFYEGLTMMDRSMIDAASGRALMDKMPAATRHLISNMAINTQQFRIRGVGQPRMVNEIDAIDNLRLENQLTELTSLLLRPRPSQGPYATQRLRSAPNVPQGATIPATATTKSTSSRRLTIFRGPDEAVSNKQSRVPTKYALQQYAVPSEYECHPSRPQNANRIVSKHCEPFTVIGSSNLPSQTILNLRGNASVVTLRSGKELPQPASQ
ncbi:hypothetical protein CR513_44363, partial [Mucuna pruriens]